MSGGFVHLHCHSSFSLRDGAVSPAELAEAAAHNGMEAIALTDHESLSGVVRFVRACERVGVTPIVGAEVHVADSNHPADGGRVVLLAPGRRGYAALCGLLTEAHMRAEDRAIEMLTERDPGWPRVGWDVLERYADFLVCLSGGPKGEVGRACAARRTDRAEAAARRYLELFGTERFRVELQRHLRPGEDAGIARARALAKRLGVRTVATNDVHYAVPEDAVVHDVLRAIRRLAPLEAEGPGDAERWVKPPLAMRSLFREAPEAVRETERLAGDLAADIGLGESCLPDFPGLRDGESAGERLARDAREGLVRRGLDGDPHARTRLDDELEVIRRRGFASYFLVCADIVREVRARRIRVACRGSGAGSLVCYATGISEVDPIRHGLLFERFLSEWRDELPDIDLDVESARREEVLDHLLRTYGAGRMGMACMFETFRARHAIRDVGKALGCPPEDIDEIAKAFPRISARAIPQAREHLPELKTTALRGPEVERLLHIATRLDGFPRHLALHPSGVLLASVDLDTRTPLQPSFARFPMSQHDKDDVDALGLLKLDVIGVRMLSAMDHARGEVERSTGADLDLDRVPTDDPETFELIRTSRTLGCFQIESPGQRELVTKLLPGAFGDLIVDISLFRPGPVKADMVGPYLNRRHGYAEPHYAHPVLKGILRETHGVVVFHEQVMRILAAFCGMSLGEADAFRRAMDAEGDDLERLHERFVRAARANGFDAGGAEAGWREIASFAAFGFCKAHAAAFAVPTYQSAWLKAHHPAAFLAGILTHDPGMYPKRSILAEARRLGIPVLPLDVERSDATYRVEPCEGELGIRLSLADVRGISDEEVERIVAERPFGGVEDLVRRARPKRPVAEALCECGALDRFGPRRLVLLELARLYGGGLIAGVRGGKRELRELGFRPTSKPPAGQASLFDDGHPKALVRDAGERLGAWEAREPTTAERVRAELEILSLDVTCHVLELYEPTLRAIGWTPAAELPRLRAGTEVVVAGVKTATQTPAIRSGKRIIFCTLDDPTGLSDLALFPDAQDACARTVFGSWLLVCRGTLRRTGRVGASVVMTEARDLAALARERGEAPGARIPTSAGRGRLYSAPKGRGRLYHASGGSAG